MTAAIDFTPFTGSPVSLCSYWSCCLAACAQSALCGASPIFEWRTCSNLVEHQLRLKVQFMTSQALCEGNPRLRRQQLQQQQTKLQQRHMATMWTPSIGVGKRPAILTAWGEMFVSLATSPMESKGLEKKITFFSTRKDTRVNLYFSPLLKRDSPRVILLSSEGLNFKDDIVVGWYGVFPTSIQFAKFHPVCHCVPCSLPLQPSS